MVTFSCVSNSRVPHAGSLSSRSLLTCRSRYPLVAAAVVVRLAVAVGAGRRATKDGEEVLQLSLIVQAQLGLHVHRGAEKRKRGRRQQRRIEPSFSLGAARAYYSSFPFAVTSIANLLLRRSSPRAFQRCADLSLTPRGSQFTHRGSIPPPP